MGVWSITDMIVYVHYGSCKNGVCVYTPIISHRHANLFWSLRPPVTFVSSTGHPMGTGGGVVMLGGVGVA